MGLVYSLLEYIVYIEVMVDTNHHVLIVKTYMVIMFIF